MSKYKILLDSGASTVVLQQNLTRGARGWAPTVYPPYISPHEVAPMKLFIGLGWFSLYLHRKPMFGSIVQQASLRHTRIGTFPPTAIGIR